jgi:hypothetical protein
MDFYTPVLFQRETLSLSLSFSGVLSYAPSLFPSSSPAELRSRSHFQNAIIYVSSTQGMNSSGCGEAMGPSACRTVVYACGQGEGDGASGLEVVVGVGMYTETAGVNVAGTLSVTGVCVLLFIMCFYG